MTENLNDEEFIETTVKSIVTKPDKVEVKRSIDERGVLIELKVDAEDMGTIIGKEGRTAKALRTLLRVIGAKNDARVNLKIIEPDGSTRPTRRSDEENDVVAEAMSDVPQDTVA